MSRASHTLTLLFCALLVQGAVVAEEQEQSASGAARLQRQSDIISSIESRHGAYAAELTEHLLSFGKQLQTQGRHDEALAVFKRGIHIERINGGLRSSGQIPLLKSEIESLIAARNYELADERQSYLYRVQARNLPSSDALTIAFMQQAQWQFDAYLLELDEFGHARLINMAELYARARDDIAAREGDRSPKLLQPLLGLLQTQYLIASYRGGGVGSSESPSQSRNRYRFAQYQLHVDEEVKTTLSHLARIERRKMEPLEWQAKTGAMLGDWLLWSGEYEMAMSAYSDTIAELESAEGAKTSDLALLDTPVALPDLEGLQWLPSEAEQRGDNTVQVSFDVTPRGRVVNLDRMDENEALDSKARQLMRKLRDITFRPRFEAGAPVETTDIVKTYVME